jgi:hypothetical protein
MRDQGVTAEGQATLLRLMLGLGSREALGGLGRPFPGLQSLIDIGGPDLEGEPQLLEKLPAPGRSGGEDESGRSMKVSPSSRHVFSDRPVLPR